MPCYMLCEWLVVVDFESMPNSFISLFFPFPVCPRLLFVYLRFFFHPLSFGVCVCVHILTFLTDLLLLFSSLSPTPPCSSHFDISCLFFHSSFTYLFFRPFKVFIPFGRLAAATQYLLVSLSSLPLLHPMKNEQVAFHSHSNIHSFIPY